MHKTALTLPIAVVLLVCASLRAGDGSLLEQLQEETRGLAADVARAVVSVRRPSATPLPLAGGATLRATYTVHASSAGAVLVGSPARVVAAYSTIGNASKVEVTLPDGSEASAELVVADAEFGISVYALPAETAARWQGLELARDWNDVRAGTLGVAAAGGARLSMVTRAVPVLGWVYTGVEEGDVALVGARRRLLGVRTDAHAPAADVASCASCHADADGTTLYTVNLPSANRLGHNRLIAVERMATGVAVLSTTQRVEGAPDAYVAGPVIARVLDDVDESGRIRQSYAGVVLGGTTGRGDDAGVQLTAVLDGSPAAEAGLVRGQRIVRIDGVRVTSAATLSRALTLRRPGDTVVLERVDPQADDGKAEAVRVALGDRQQALTTLVSERTLGLTCVDLGLELRRFLELEDSVGGAAVQAVERGSAAHKAGLRRGDVIVWAGGGAVADVEELRAAFAAARDRIAFRILRPGASGAIDVTLAIPKARAGTR